jgi:alkanesulfonate monooxygenase SsuD/methylene tetrahydromethanopterin reductase-like flavin-dependent oxidoreductase (luciferase family)
MSSRSPKVGLFLPTGEIMLGGATAGWRDLLELARRAEDLGFDSLWLPDHVLLGRGAESDAIGAWECWSLLAALAAATIGVELGPLVSCTAYRNPALLAKMASTVDEISGGRLVLGLGAGWAESEFRAFGFPFDHRVSRFEEAIRIISDLLRNGRVDFSGAFHSAHDCELRPLGPRPHGPSIMVGASGPRMHVLTARYADDWNADFGSTPESIRSLNDAVDTACREVGRDPATLKRSASVLVDVAGHGQLGDHWVADSRAGRALSGSTEELATVLRSYADAGIGHVQVWLDPNTVAGVEAFAPVLRLLDHTD